MIVTDEMLSKASHERARTARKVLEAVQKQLLAFGLRVDLIETGTDQIEWEIVRTTTPSPEGVDKELIERLRAVQFSSFINRDIEMCREAADRLEALTTETERCARLVDALVLFLRSREPSPAQKAVGNIMFNDGVLHGIQWSANCAETCAAAIKDGKQEIGLK